MIKSLFSSRHVWPAATLLLGLGMGILGAAVLATGLSPARDPQATLDSMLPKFDLEASSKMLHAATGVSNDVFCMCTGEMEDSEGLFMLDGLTGELRCIVIHPRTGQIGATFSINVAQAMGAAPNKKPRYLMCTGMTQFVRGGSALRLARSVVYVIDANTGAYAAFGVPWNQNNWTAGRPMVASLQPLVSGVARQVQVNE